MGIIAGQGPTVFAVDVSWGYLEVLFYRLSFLFSFFLSLGGGSIAQSAIKLKATTTITSILSLPVTFASFHARDMDTRACTSSLFAHASIYLRIRKFAYVCKLAQCVRSYSPIWVNFTLAFFTFALDRGQVQISICIHATLFMCKPGHVYAKSNLHV